MAAGPAVNEENPIQGKLSPEDELILREPFAEALSFMGHTPDVVVHAVKMLQNQRLAIDVRILLETVERLETIKESGGPLPPLEAKKTSGRPRLGSDGQEESDNSEPGPLVSRNTNDLQTDGEQQVTQRRMPERLLPEMGGKAGSIQNKEDRAALQRKLQALRQENKLLKERQMCRGCRHRPVSITFLPCGHYAFCYDCGQTFGACPICRKTILADVRTFLA